MQQYKIVTGSKTDVEKEVSKLLQKGWFLCGNLIAIFRGCNTPEIAIRSTQYAQPMYFTIVNPINSPVPTETEIEMELIDAIKQ